MFVIIIFLLSNFTFAQSKSQKTTQEWCDIGVEKYDAGKYQDAIPFLKKAVDMDNKNHYALNQLGLCYFSLKDYNKTKEYFRLAILYSDKVATYYTNMGVALSMLDENEKAYEYARKALALEEDGQTLFNAVSFANNLDKYNECLKMLDNSTIEKNPAFFSLYGRCYYKKKDYINTIKSYEEFFSKYNPEDNFAPIDMDAERDFQNAAYFYEIADQSISEADRNQYLDKAVQAIHSKNKENPLSVFFDYDNICTGYGYSSELCTRFFKRVINDATPIQKLNFEYYALRDFKTSFDVSGQLLVSNQYKGEDLYKIKLIQYLSSLNLSFQSVKTDKNWDVQKFDNTVELFKNLYEKKMYNSEEFKDDESLREPISETLKVFKRSFQPEPDPDPQQEEKVKILIKKILENIPNEYYRTGFLNILNGGRNNQIN